MSSIFDTPLRRISPEETLLAVKNIKQLAVRTPLVKLNYSRPDHPNLDIYLKLETLQPINSFKVRGAVNKIKSIDSSVLKERYDNVIVSASAGNMGQGVAFAARTLGCECVVVVPDHAPQTKLNAMSNNYGAKVIKVPFPRWWEIITTGNANDELHGRNHLFVHPVCDPLVVAGNSTIGLEILEDMPDCDAVFCSWGGGGCSSGIGSVLKNARERPECFPHLELNPDTDSQQHKIDMVSVEPATAAPLCYSFNNNKTLTPLPTNPDDPNSYRPSWIDGCGGKSVLRPMWDLAKDVLTGAYKVELEAVEHALKVLVEKNRIISEGAGACPVAAAMFGPVKPHWKKVVAVVCGGCIDTPVLLRILENAFHEPYKASPGFSFTSPIHCSSPALERIADSSPSKPLVLSAAEVRVMLPMAECIDAVEGALSAYANGTGVMPLRQVTKLLFSEQKVSQFGFLGSMPSYTNGLENDYACCKCISVFPRNSETNGRFSSHQGVVLLWNKAGNGELLLVADAHEITKIRTAAASAVATREIMGKARCKNAKVLGILGTGDQARSHIDAMMIVLPSLRAIHIWGRNTEKARILQQETTRKYSGVTVTQHESVASCIIGANVICTVTSSTAPILTEEHENLFEPGCHINAVGACTPQFQEISPTIFRKRIAFSTKIFTDSLEACIKEPGDVLAYLEMIGEDAADNFVGIGDVLTGREGINGKDNFIGLTIFKSLGISLEDLFAARLLYDKAVLKTLKHR